MCPGIHEEVRESESMLSSPTGVAGAAPANSMSIPLVIVLSVFFTLMTIAGGKGSLLRQSLLDRLLRLTDRYCFMGQTCFCCLAVSHCRHNFNSPILGAFVAVRRTRASASAATAIGMADAAWDSSAESSWDMAATHDA